MGRHAQRTPCAALHAPQICTAVGVSKQAPPLPEGLPPPLTALLLNCFDADPARRPTAVHLLRVSVCWVHGLFGPCVHGVGRVCAARGVPSIAGGASSVP
jgi:hypothetical protein